MRIKKQGQPSRKAIHNWISDQPEKVKDSILTHIIADNDYAAATTLQQEFLKYHQSQHGNTPATAPTQRTAGELLSATERYSSERKKADAKKRAQEQQRREQEAAQARAQYLDTLKTRQSQT